MRAVIVKSALVVAGSVVVSLMIAGVVVPAMGGVLDKRTLVMCIVCPIVLAGPATAYAEWQQLKLRRANQALVAAHAALAEAHARLAEKARRDQMTGMLNRETFLEMVENALDQRAGGSLMIIDADNFKRINDTYGHVAGDEALLQITGAICRAVGRENIVGRIGGEEFAILLPAASREATRSIAERVRREVERSPLAVAADQRLSLSVSIGVTEIGEQENLSQLLKEADRRLYEAKRRGRNRVIHGDAATMAA
jgi:diguanylate cyclase (GGDEF)-like protein